MYGKFLGIEIGGTKLQVGLGAEEPGKLDMTHRFAAHSDQGAQEICRQMKQGVLELLEQASIDREEIVGAGIGFGGPVHKDLLTVVKSHQVNGWEEFPLSQWLIDNFEIPAVVHNDADTAALAEARFGAGKDCNPIFYITIGSGIGGGLIVDGEIYRGLGSGASEVGHMKVPVSLFKQSFDAQGESWVNLESICSGWSIAKRADHIERSGEPTILTTFRLAAKGGLTAEMVKEGADNGDKVCRQLIEDTCCVLSVSIAQMITLMAPQRVVIGGGISHLGERLLFDPLRKEVERYVFPPLRGCYEIVPAALGDDVVLHGAVEIARDAFG